MKFLLCVLAVLFACLAVSDAQSEEVTGRSCRILFLNPPKDAPKTLHLFDGTNCQEVQVPSMSLSPVYRIAADARKLHLLAEKPEDPSAIPPEAPSVDLPEDGGDFYLILSSDPKNPIIPVAAQVYHPSPALRKGQLFWINLTDKTIEGKLGEEALSLAPDASQILDAPTKKVGAYSILLTYRAQDDASPARTFCQTQWMHNPNSRHLAIVYTDEAATALRAISFPDFRVSK